VDKHFTALPPICTSKQSKAARALFKHTENRKNNKSEKKLRMSQKVAQNQRWQQIISTTSEHRTSSHSNKHTIDHH
jgi:tRNA A37 threonylcarbamoyltransferase TsaD